MSLKYKALWATLDTLDPDMLYKVNKYCSVRVDKYRYRLKKTISYIESKSKIRKIGRNMFTIRGFESNLIVYIPSEGFYQSTEYSTEFTETIITKKTRMLSKIRNFIDECYVNDSSVNDIDSDGNNLYEYAVMMLQVIEDLLQVSD